MDPTLLFSLILLSQLAGVYNLVLNKTKFGLRVPLKGVLHYPQK
jgi:hypothetical protein